MLRIRGETQTNQREMGMSLTLLLTIVGVRRCSKIWVFSRFLDRTSCGGLLKSQGLRRRNCGFDKLQPGGASQILDGIPAPLGCAAFQTAATTFVRSYRCCCCSAYLLQLNTAPRRPRLARRTQRTAKKTAAAAQTGGKPSNPLDSPLLPRHVTFQIPLTLPINKP